MVETYLKTRIYPLQWVPNSCWTTNNNTTLGRKSWSCQSRRQRLTESSIRICSSDRVWRCRGLLLVDTRCCSRCFKVGSWLLLCLLQLSCLLLGCWLDPALLSSWLTICIKLQFMDKLYTVIPKQVFPTFFWDELYYFIFSLAGI